MHELNKLLWRMLNVMLALVIYNSALAMEKCKIASVDSGEILVKKISVPLPYGPVDCGDISVSKGRVYVCLDQDGLKNPCKVFVQGQNINSKVFVEDKRARSFLKVLTDMLFSTSTHVDAVSRGGIDGLPNGTVILINNSVLIDLTENDSKKIDFISFYRLANGKDLSLIKQIKGGTKTWLESSMFIRGEEYVWRMTPNNVVVQSAGRFKVMSNSDKNDIDYVLSQISDKESEGIGIVNVLLQATWLMENGYKFDAMQVLEYLKPSRN